MADKEAELQRAKNLAVGSKSITELARDASGKRERVNRDLIESPSDENSQIVLPVQERQDDEDGLRADYQRWLAHKARLKESRKANGEAPRRIKVAQSNLQKQQPNIGMQLI